MVKHKIKIRIITEDNSKKAIEVFTNLFKSILKNSIDEFDSRVIKLPDNDGFNFEDVMSGNRWTQKRPRDKGLSFRIREFKRAISQYLIGENCFILWHFDGDMEWSSSKDGEKCKTLQQFKIFIESIPKNEKNKRITDEHFLMLIPFYSIEAWLYQNRKVLKTISKTEDILSVPPEKLDEIKKVKEEFTIKAKYNLELSRQFPFSDVFKLNKSFTSSILTIQRNKTLKEQLSFLQK